MFAGMFSHKKLLLPWKVQKEPKAAHFKDLATTFRSLTSIP